MKDPNSFAFLLDHTKWPETICGEKFIFPSVPLIPPQLSLDIKNVDLKVDFIDFSNEVKQLYPDVMNVIRMKNKFGNEIKLVKLELISPKTRDILLSSKKMFLHYICYDIDDYLAPVNVLRLMKRVNPVVNHLQNLKFIIVLQLLNVNIVMEIIYRIRYNVQLSNLFVML